MWCVPADSMHNGMVDIAAKTKCYRGTSLIRNTHPPGSPQVPRHRATSGSYGEVFLMGEVTL